MQFSNILIEAVRYDVIYSYSKHEYKTSAMHQSHKVLLFISKQHFNQLLGKCHGVCVLKQSMREILLTMPCAIKTITTPQSLDFVHFSIKTFNNE